MKYLLHITTLLFLITLGYTQNSTQKVLWDKKANQPIAYATITTDNENVISNNEGVFSLNSIPKTLAIQSITYYDTLITPTQFHANDTLFMRSKNFVLNEIVIENENSYKKMVGTIKSHFALQPHDESFFLRAIIKKNDSLYKIADFAGNLRKETLFGTKSLPVPKKNYTVHLKHMRKVGLDGRHINFIMLDFNYLLNFFATINFSPDIYNYTYENTDDHFLKITALPKDPSKVRSTGYYIVNDTDYILNEAYLSTNQIGEFVEIGGIKNRNNSLTKKTTFKQNPTTHKYQLNFAFIQDETEVVYNGNTDIYSSTYIFYSTPKSPDVNLKNNINLNKDIFELKVKYDATYWDNQTVLPLTAEMQEFINKVNLNTKNKEFKSVTNIK